MQDNEPNKKKMGIDDLFAGEDKETELFYFTFTLVRKVFSGVMSSGHINILEMSFKTPSYLTVHTHDFKLMFKESDQMVSRKRSTIVSCLLSLHTNHNSGFADRS